MTIKDPHAVALGRKGGKAKGKPKGFAAMEPAKAKRIRQLAAFIRKAMSEPDEQSFARAISNHWFCKATDTRTAVFNIEFVLPLVSAGYLVEDRTEKLSGFTEHYYKPTKDGLKWWAETRLKNLEEIEEKYRPTSALAKLLGDFDQKEAGDTIKHDAFFFYPALRGLLEGLSTFKGYDFTPPHSRSFEYLTVRLTAKGEAFWRNAAPPIGEW